MQLKPWNTYPNAMQVFGKPKKKALDRQPNARKTPQESIAKRPSYIVQTTKMKLALLVTPKGG